MSTEIRSPPDVERREPGPGNTDSSRSPSDHGRSVRRDKPSVFVLDESVRAELFEFWLADGCRVMTATSPSAIRDTFDGSVTVALVRNEASTEAKEEVQRQIASKASFCRTVITTTEHVEILFPEIEYDVCLSEPTTRDEVRETVSRLARRAEYQKTLDRYYSYAVRAANMEVQHSSDELREDPNYAHVSDVADRLKRWLEAILETFDSDDLSAVQQSIRPETGFGPEYTKDNKKKGEKHRPDKCVGCGLAWGVDHGGTLDQGYRRLGAYVWKCADCGTVQNLPDPSHRRLARR